MLVLQLFIAYLAIIIINILVPPKYRVVILKSKTIKLGTLYVDETTILEWKPLFSVKTFYFHPGDAQEIFHTHSFSAHSFLICGNYVEAFYDPVNGKLREENRNRSTCIYIPRDRFHQITNSIGCRTIMITGPWGDSYAEFKKETNELIISTHGRLEIARNYI